jgi:hypothetical protein
MDSRTACRPFTTFLAGLLSGVQSVFQSELERFFANFPAGATPATWPPLTQVEAWLAAHPERREHVEAWRVHSVELHRLCDQVLDEPIAARLMPPAIRVGRNPWRAVVAVQAPGHDARSSRIGGSSSPAEGREAATG